MIAFLSYRLDDRHVAAEVGKFLEMFGITAFMAHEDINVSHEWQQTILDQLEAADIFIAILSEDYIQSTYCLQESGIAVFRKAKMTIIPLSIDGTVPPGFMAHIQSRRIEAGNVSQAILLAGIAKHDPKVAIDGIIKRIRASPSYAATEDRFDLLHPYLDQASEKQIAALLEAAVENPQIRHTRAIQPALRELLKSHGHLLKKQDLDLLEGTRNQ
jgi:translation initiation factor 6 (eIF-6)